MVWGSTTLIVLLIVVGSFVFYQQWTELQQMKKEAAEDDKQREDHISKPDEPIVSSDKPITKDDLPAADPGFKWVLHDDHFHQVPIDAPDEWQGGPHEPITQPAPEVASDEWQSPPVSGHWSDHYLPPLEELLVMYADDKDAMYVLSRTKTLLQYGKGSHDPVAYKAFVELSNFLNDMTSRLGTDVSLERFEELVKLQWPLLDEPPKGWEGSKYLIKGENDE